MKRFLIGLSLLLPLLACNPSKENLMERTLELCQYIPDHELKPEAKDYMTAEFYQALSDAFNAPVEDTGAIGDEEWLYYFVTGNAGTEPCYEVKSVSQVSKEEAAAVIIVRQAFDGEILPNEDPAEYAVSLKKVDGKWLLDDFDGKKAQCREYVEELKKQGE